MIDILFYIIVLSIFGYHSGLYMIRGLFSLVLLRGDCGAVVSIVFLFLCSSFSIELDGLTGPSFADFVAGIAFRCLRFLLISDPSASRTL